jgi:hypothetical protein
MKKKFNCKAEEVTAIAGFVAVSLDEDFTDFQDFSPDYTPDYKQKLIAKRQVCLELEKSDISIQLLKKVTGTLVAEEQKLRLPLNKVEGYLSRGAESLDIAPDNFGIHDVRSAISRGNDEGIIANLKKLLSNVTRNQTVLEANGLKQEVVATLAASCNTIDELNNQQNKLANQRNANTDANLDQYNELWDITNAVLSDARAIYKGVDEVKLKKYTLSLLIKRVNAEGSDKKEEKKETSSESPK